MIFSGFFCVAIIFLEIHRIQAAKTITKNGSKVNSFFFCVLFIKESETHKNCIDVKCSAAGVTRSWNTNREIE